MQDSSLPKWFIEVVDVGRSLRDRAGVLIVANVKGVTNPIDDYEGDSIVTEFLSAEELDCIVQYFERAGFYCEVIFNEDGFLEWCSRACGTFPRKEPVVYNLAQNGSGPGRLTLVARLCQLRGIPLLDSDAYGVAISHNKFHALSLLEKFGIPVAPSWWFTKHGWWPTAPPPAMRLIAKPSYESASIGVSTSSVFVMNESSPEFLSSMVKRYRQPLTVQQFVPGLEVEVPVFDVGEPMTLAAIGISLDGQRVLGDRVLTYDDVFRDAYGFYDLSESSIYQAERAMNSACSAFRGLGLAGIGRVDFRIPDDGVPLIMEINAKPHLTSHSSVVRALELFGASGADLANLLIGSAFLRHHDQVNTRSPIHSADQN